MHSFYFSFRSQHVRTETMESVQEAGTVWKLNQMPEVGQATGGDPIGFRDK